MEPIWEVIILSGLILIAGTILIGSITVKKLNFINEKYEKYKTISEANTEQICTILLANAAVPVKVVKINKNISSKYSPHYKVLKLSKTTAESISIVSLAKTSQEVGYAILDFKNSFMYKIKKFLIPIANIMLISFIPTFILSLALKFSFNLNTLGIILAILSLGFLILPILIYMITIPSINKASAEVALQLDKLKFIDEKELFSIKDILYYSVFTHFLGIFTNMFFLMHSFTNL